MRKSLRIAAVLLIAFIGPHAAGSATEEAATTTIDCSPPVIEQDVYDGNVKIVNKSNLPCFVLANVFNGNVTIDKGGHISFVGNKVMGSLTVKGTNCRDSDEACDAILHENTIFGPLKVQGRDGAVLMVDNLVVDGNATFKKNTGFLWITTLRVSNGNLKCQNNTGAIVAEGNIVSNGTDNCGSSVID